MPSTISFPNARNLSFDGTNDYVSVADNNTLDLTTDISISVWVKLDTLTNKHHNFVDKGLNGYIIGVYSDTAASPKKISWSKNGIDEIVSTTQLAAGTWYHIAATHSNGARKIYINGIEDASGTGKANFENTTQALQIGENRTLADWYLDGNIDDVRIYNRALSATEISALAAGTHPLATWDGDTSTNFETAGNWDIGAIPDPYNRVTIANAGARPLCTANIQTTGLTINSGASLDLSSYNLTQNDSGTFTNNGTLLLNGTQALTNFTNDTDTGTEIIRGSTNLTGFPTGTTYNNLRIEDPTENGLVGYWKLDEGGGTSAADLSGNANTGTLTNGPTYSTTVNSTTTYPNGYSLSFDGTDDNVNANDSTSLDSLNNDVTISIWVKPGTTQSSTYTGLIDRHGCTNQCFVVQQEGSITNAFYFGVNIGGTWYCNENTNSYTQLTANTWQNFVVQRSGSKVYHYLNGAKTVDCNATSGSITATDNPLRIGFSCLSRYFNGSIDDVRIYNRALSATEIANLAAGRYAAGDTGTATHTLNGNVTVNGTLALDSGILSTSSYTNTVTGLATLNGGTYTAGTATQTFNGGLTVAGGTYTGGTGTSDVNGALTVSAGTLTAPGSTSSLNVSGNFAHSGGTFTHNSGTVLLDGNDQTISGATTFNNLTKTTSNTTLTFPASTTQTVAGTLTLQGASGLPISLRSSTLGTQWNIDPQGTRTVEYLDIKDSNNINATAISLIPLDRFTNSGNNTNWTFNQNPPAPTVSSATIAGTSAGTSGTYSVNYGEALSINFTSTDSDGSDTVTLSTPSSPSIGTFTAASAANPGTGSFTFTPGVSHVGMSYNFTVRATDNNSAASSSDLTVTINVGSNIPPDVPTISSATINGMSTSSYVITDGQALVINFTASDSNGSDTVTLSTPSSPTVGTFTGASAANPGTATYTFTPTVDHVNRTYTFTVRATDNNSAASSSDLSVSVKVNPTQAALDTIQAGTFEIEQSLMGGNSGESSTTSATSPTIIIVTPPTPEEDKEPETTDNSSPKPPALPKPPKPQEPTNKPPLAPPNDDIESEDEESGDTQEIIVKFPEVPDILKNPITISDEENLGGIGKIGKDPRDPKKEPKIPKGPKETPPEESPPEPSLPSTPKEDPSVPKAPQDDNIPETTDKGPKDKPDKGQTQSTNIIIAGSPTSFVLPGEAPVVTELKSAPLIDIDVKVIITDSEGKEHTIPASVLVGAGKDDNSPLVINTDTLPENLAVGPAILSLVINGEVKAKINVVITESQFKAGGKDGGELATLRPIITSVNAKRKKDILTITITGDNYHNKKLEVNDNVIETKNRLTQITMLPNSEVKRIAWEISKDGKVIIAKYKILEKDLTGTMTITVTNPFGQAISTFDMPGNKR